MGTGHMVATVSSSEIDHYAAWERANQSMVLTTNAKPTKIAKSASVKNMVIAASVNLSVTHGNSLPNPTLSSHVTKQDHVNVSSLNVIFNLSKIHLHKKNNSQTITMHSGQQLVLTEKRNHHVHQVATIQSTMNAAVARPNHISGLDSTRANAAMVMS